MKGFLEGYKRMEGVGCIVFGVVVMKGIKGGGVRSKKGVRCGCMKGGVIAAWGLRFVYL
ncbi:branched-chain amino acid transport system II carrier protein [Bacillus altitudinis]|uniref:branched-chain amino acid transport system II carrier protein n=1 Tax=Bacillus altitudinis TaxID=293387 RepID=UPI002357C0A2|nr:branched-chain amino acid transport system II carrier protein [Bacillus altitudinis]